MKPERFGVCARVVRRFRSRLLVVVAVQAHLAAESAAYRRLSASMEVVEIPTWGELATVALGAIMERRFTFAGCPAEAADVFSEAAMHSLVQFYDDTGRNVRKVLAAAHDAVVEAAQTEVEQVGPAHIRVGASGYL